MAGYKGPALFSPAVTKKLAKASKGIPRLVNILCHKILMLAYGQGSYTLTARHLILAINDTEDTQLNWQLRAKLLIMSKLMTTGIVVMSLALLLVGLIYLGITYFTGVID